MVKMLLISGTILTFNQVFTKSFTYNKEPPFDSELETTRILFM